MYSNFNIHMYGNMIVFFLFYKHVLKLKSYLMCNYILFDILILGYFEKA
jgi:hypothetical protein